jgi:hypothetical protein
MLLPQLSPDEAMLPVGQRYVQSKSENIKAMIYFAQELAKTLI